MTRKSQLWPLALLALSPSLFAQAIPGAGAQLRQLTPPPPARPAEPSIHIEEGTAPAAPGTASASVLVTQLQIAGARVYSEQELLQVAAFVPGSTLTLEQLQAMAARITARYRKDGYFVARAYLAAQDVSNNVVTITVSEGHYGK